MNVGPPTARQVEVFQSFVIHRTLAATGRALGIGDMGVRNAVHGFLRRAETQFRREFKP